jgi:ribosomal protein S18 acetylase RimI-like enzyme
LRAVAIDEQYHRRGLGRQMLDRVLDDLRQRGIKRAVVGTSNAGIGEIAFYQKAGFRLWRIERDVFTAERGYDPEARLNGLPHRDMVWFEQEL